MSRARKSTGEQKWAEASKRESVWVVAKQESANERKKKADRLRALRLASAAADQAAKAADDTDPVAGKAAGGARKRRKAMPAPAS